MLLSFNSTISINELQIICTEPTHCTIRTAEVIPFFGDYICVDVSYNEFAYDMLVAEMKQLTASDVSDRTSVANQLKHQAAQVIQQQLNDYVVEMLNSQAVLHGCKPFSPLL